MLEGRLREAAWPTAVAVVPVAVTAAVLPAPNIGLVVVALFAFAVPLAWVARRAAERASWSLPILVALLPVLVDTAAVRESRLYRYGTLGAVALITFVLRRREPVALTAPRLLFGALCVYGLAGSIVGRLYLGSHNGGLPVFLPMILAFAFLLRVPPATAADSRVVLKALAVLGLAFGVLSATVNRVVETEVTVQPYSHERAFVLALGVAAAAAAGSRLLTVLSLAAAAGAFWNYPAGTYVVAAVVALLTLIAARQPPSRGAWRAISTVLVASTAWAMLHVQQLLALFAPYFAAVGKADNGRVREGFYRQAAALIEQAPIFGHLFTQNVTLTTTLSGRAGSQVPVHNDYLQLALGGGLIAAVLLLTAFLAVNGTAFRALRQPDADPHHRPSIIVLLIAINVAAVSAFANPLLLNPVTSGVVFTLVLALLSLCAPEDRDLPGVDRGGTGRVGEAAPKPWSCRRAPAFH